MKMSIHMLLSSIRMAIMMMNDDISDDAGVDDVDDTAVTHTCILLSLWF